MSGNYTKVRTASGGVLFLATADFPASGTTLVNDQYSYAMGLDTSGYLTYANWGANAGGAVARNTSWVAGDAHALDIVTDGWYAIGYTFSIKNTSGGAADISCEFAVDGGSAADFNQVISTANNDTSAFAFSWTGYLTARSHSLWVYTNATTTAARYSMGTAPGMTVNRLA